MSDAQAKHQRLIDFVRGMYPAQKTIPLHAPVFFGNEKKYLNECVDTGFVSSVGPFVARFEEQMRELTGAKCAVATTNGTSALHVALYAVGVRAGEEVITQALSFVATCNAIAYLGAQPLFVDVDFATLGMSPDALRRFLVTSAERRSGGVFNRKTGRRIGAVVPMHTFGHMTRIEELAAICQEWGLILIEDAAEALGSTYRGRAAGRFGFVGCFSFNGNKIATSGGGGCLITDDEAFGKRLKHLTTTAKQPHPYEFYHDEVGFNYRMPNINAALICAQLEQLDEFLKDKRQTAGLYEKFAQAEGFQFVKEPEGSHSNYWLNAVLVKNRKERNELLDTCIAAGIGARPIWQLMTRLPAFKAAQAEDLKVSQELEDRIVNLPSSVRESWKS